MLLNQVQSLADQTNFIQVVEQFAKISPDDSIIIGSLRAAGNQQAVNVD